MMKTALMASAVLLGVSTLAMAQTSPTAPSATPTTPPSSGSTTPGAAGSGSSGASAITGEEIKEALEQRGFSDVQVQPGGSGHKVTAMKDGKQVRMEVDPTGRVMQSR